MNEKRKTYFKSHWIGNKIFRIDLVSVPAREHKNVLCFKTKKPISPNERLIRGLEFSKPITEAQRFVLDHSVLFPEVYAKKNEVRLKPSYINIKKQIQGI